MHWVFVGAMLAIGAVLVWPALWLALMAVVGLAQGVYGVVRAIWLAVLWVFTLPFKAIDRLFEKPLSRLAARAAAQERPAAQ